MKKGIISGMSGSGKLGILLLIIIVSTLIMGALGLAVAYLKTGIGLNTSVLMDYNNPDTITYMKIMQIFQAIGLFIIPPAFAIFLFGKKGENYLQFRKTNLLFILVAGSLMIVALPLINWFAEFNQALILPDFLSGIGQWMHESEASAAKITEYFLKADNIPTLLLNLFIMALLPAFGEEMLFRGVLQRIFIQMSKNIHIGIWITAFLFSAIHMQFFTFLPRFFMGAMFGYMLVWSGSIWLTITAHFVNNGTAVIIGYLTDKGSISSDVDTIGTNNFVYIIGSFILVSTGMYYLKVKAENRFEQELLNTTEQTIEIK